MLNSKEFKGKMVARGYTQKELAKKLNMSENALSLKIRGKNSFTLDEVEKICGVFELEEPGDKCKIFLP